MSDQPAETVEDEAVAEEPTAGQGEWQRRAIGWGAVAALASAVLAVTANLSEIAGWFAPDETRELVEETRGVIENTEQKVGELLTLLRNQAAASGVDLNIEAEAAIENAIRAIVISGNAQKQAALRQLDAGDVSAAAGMLTSLAATQAAAVSETRAAAASSWREAGALFYTYDVAQAVRSYEQADRLEPGNPATLRLLGHALVRAGRLADAERAFEEILALAPPPADVSAAYFGLGHIAKTRGRYAQAAEQLHKALGISEAHGLSEERIHALVVLGQLATAQGNAGQASLRLATALSLAEELGDEALQADVLDAMGTSAARQERYADAERLMQRALDIHTSQRDAAGRAHTLGNLGALALLRGDIDVAETILLETVELGEQLGWQSSIAYDLVNLAGIAAAKRDFVLADERLGRAQAIAGDVGLAELAPVIVFNRGEIARDSGDMDAACRHWLEALPLLIEMGSAHAGTAKSELDAAGCGHD